MAARKNRNRSITIYDVHGLDVWGNAREGFEVNDVYPSQGAVWIFNDATDQEIVRALKDEGFIDKLVRNKSVNIEGEMGINGELYISEARSGKPVYQLRSRMR